MNIIHALCLHFFLLFCDATHVDHGIISIDMCSTHRAALHHWLVGGWTETIHRRVSNIFCIFLNSNLGPHKLRTGASTTELSVRFVFTMIC